MNTETHRIASGSPSGWLPVIAGLVLGLFGIGLPMIGVTINLTLGFAVFAGTFALIAWGCWIWEGKFPRRKPLRIITICIFAVVYFSLVMVQISSQYRKDHLPVYQTAPSQPTVTPGPSQSINQTATDSTCANQVAQSGSKTDCDTGKESHAKEKHTH